MNKFRVPFGIILLTLGIVLGIQFEKVFSGDHLRDSIEKLNDVLTYIEKYYVEDVNSQKIVESGINGMLDQLDPHSVYIPASNMEAVEESFKGEFEGIGIEYQVVNDTLTVVSPITGGPSEALGILSGDRIIKIDDKEVIGITNDDVKKSLRGKSGTSVKITVVRPGLKNTIVYTITRDKIPLYSVDTHFMMDNSTGYVSVSRFAETTNKELLTALEDLKSKGMKQLILDLRSNPGGYLNQAVEMADLFLPGKKKIVYTEGRRSEFNEEFFSSEGSDFENVPIIVLVNKGSASASEIVSGAIQDWDRGLIVGETTFGKGLVQRQFTLSDNSAVRITISKYFTPSGRLIQRDYKDKKNKEEYYSEITDKDEKEGENLNHTAEEDSVKPIFKTNAGRVVYGGGGITPDFIIKAHNISEYTTELLKNNLLYLYALKYLDESGASIKSNYPDLAKFKQDFKLPEERVKDFVKYAESKGVKFNEKEFSSDKDYIVTRLKAHIARNFWKNEGWYSVLLQMDNQVNKAAGLFTEARDLARLK